MEPISRGLLDFWTSSISNIQKNITFWKLDLLTSSNERMGATDSVGPLGRVNLNHWTRFYSSEHETMSKVQNLSNPECYTPSTEPYGTLQPISSKYGGPYIL
jgi:hypothetical protein